MKTCVNDSCFKDLISFVLALTQACYGNYKDTPKYFPKSLKKAESCMIHMEIFYFENQTITEFVPLVSMTQPSHISFSLFTLTYASIIIVNMLITVAVVNFQRLHTPMYLFLANLSFLEILYTSTVVPNMLEVFLQKAPVSGCLLQFFIFGFQPQLSALYWLSWHMIAT